MNPTNSYCPSDIPSYSITDYRPSKSLYVNVRDNNEFRQFMQHNGINIMRKNLQNFAKTMNCSCEKQPVTSIPKFNSSILDSTEKGDVFLKTGQYKRYIGYPGGVKTNHGPAYY